MHLRTAFFEAHLLSPSKSGNFERSKVTRFSWNPPIPLRVEFLLKTDIGYPKDSVVTLFTLATPGNPLRCNTHRSAPPVSALAHSRAESQSPFNMVEHRGHCYILPARVTNPRGEAFLCGPKGGFWLDDFSRKILPWVPYHF